MEEQWLGLHRTRPRPACLASREDRTTGRGNFASAVSTPTAAHITRGIAHGPGKGADRGLDPEKQHHRRDSVEQGKRLVKSRTRANHASI
ncbi:hypothetical protein EJB05_42509 [Eragrostis curvula]|uniref:Uncharacterized protein n=1 Tax=Eragrostis curvula TaxID=38414 RepID=A0A5J9TCL6_9POAL|nr:hypothetical protein EJB05_42509 [Eragrostis curvula]